MQLAMCRGAMSQCASGSFASEDVVRREAVREGLRRHLPSLVAHARRLTRCRTQAEDVVQESAARAMAFAGSFEPGTNVKAWLHQVLESVFLSSCRRRVRERRALDALGRDPCAWTRGDDAPSMRALSRRVTNALEQLPPTFRDVVRLVDVEELSYKDAASELSVPLGTVMSRLHRARRLLANALADPPARAA